MAQHAVHPRRRHRGSLSRRIHQTTGRVEETGAGGRPGVQNSRREGHRAGRAAGRGQPEGPAGTLQPGRRGRPSGVVRGHRGRAAAGRVQGGATRLRRTRTRAEAGSVTEGRRADRRDLPVRRVDPLAADADDGLYRRVRRREGTRDCHDRGNRRGRRRQPCRLSVRARPGVQPRAALR